MTTRNKVIITCAVTGAIHTPSMSPYLPVTPEEITAAAVGAAEAGAAIIHLHARDPVTGKPDQTPEAFGRFLPQIKQASNAVVNITTGGAPYMRVEERVKPALQFKPEVGSLNMGSMNIGLFHMLDRYKEFKHSWEPGGLENSRDGVFRNTFRDIEFVLRSCADNDTRFEFECYDIGHLYSLSHFLERGLVILHSLSSPYLVYSAASVHIPRMSSTCGAPPIASSATVIAGPCSVLAAIR